MSLANSHKIVQAFLAIFLKPEAMLKMKETPQPNATMMTQKVMRKRKTSCSMLLIDRMMGPKYFVAMPIWMNNGDALLMFM